MRKKHYSKRDDILKSKNSRYIFINTPETEIMFDLTIATDELFKKIRKEKSIEDANKIIKNFQKTLIKISNILEIIGENTGIEYEKPLSISLLEKDVN